MKFSKFSLAALTPVLAANLYSQYGMLFLNWNVADLFFWFWCEFVLAGIANLALLPFLPAPKHLSKGMATFVFAFSFLYISIFASMFAGMAYMGVWKSWNWFPLFFEDKKIGLLATIFSYAFVFVRIITKQDSLKSVGDATALSFFRKALVVLGIYVIFMIHGWIREWTSGARLEMSPTYLKAMGVTLIALKLLVETGFLDRFDKHRPSNKE